MPANTTQSGRRSVCDDESVDEFQQESELSRLRRQMYVMEEDRRGYAAEACDRIRKNEAEIKSLKEENDEIDTIMKLVLSEKNKNVDARGIDTLFSQIDKLDEYRRRCKQEEREIKRLDEDILRTQSLINEERKLIGCAKEEDVEVNIQNRLRMTENRLEQDLIKFNNQIAINTNLREELEVLRQDKAAFDAIYTKFCKHLAETKKETNDIITHATRAYEERGQIQNKMVTIKDRSDKDIAQQEMEMTDLMRIIKHDDQLKKFMGIKVNERIELKEEENAKKLKGKDTGDKETDSEKQAIKLLRDAFSRITQATGVHDIDQIVTEFITKEDQNFAFYNYVNELNDTVAGMKDEISCLKNEIKEFEEEECKSEDNRRQVIKEMEQKAERYSTEVDAVEKKDKVVRKVLDEIRVAVGKLFKEAGCDPSAICDMLGSEEGVTNKNILQYMGIIEQRTLELIKLQQYSNMKKEGPPKERRDIGHYTPPSSGQYHRPSPKPVAIVAPSTVDDEEFLIEDGELRPLTRNEIKFLVQRTLHVRMSCGDQTPKLQTPKLQGKQTGKR